MFENLPFFVRIDRSEFHYSMKEYGAVGSFCHNKGRIYHFKFSNYIIAQESFSGKIQWSEFVGRLDSLGQIKPRGIVSVKKLGPPKNEVLLGMMDNCEGFVEFVLFNPEFFNDEFYSDRFLKFI